MKRQVLGARGRYLHEDLLLELRARIEQGLWPPGACLPSRAELARKFGVSEITVRRALRDLTTEGLLRARPGVGVFVRNAPRIIRRLSTRVVADEMREPGTNQATRLLSLSLVKGDDPGASRLEAEPDQLLYRVERLLFADDEPITIDVSYVSEEVGERIKARLSEDFILPLLVASGVDFGHREFRIEGGAASETEARLLGVPLSFPVLVGSYVLRSRDMRPVLVGRGVSRADRLAYEFSAPLQA